MDEDLTGRTGELIAGLALFRDASAPAPSPELAAMFAATATTAHSALPTPRRAPVYKRTLRGIPGKIVAGALGALLAGSVGAGALTGTMAGSFDSDDDAPAVEAPAVDDGAVVGDEAVSDEDEADEAVSDEDGGEAEHEDAEAVAVDEVDDDGANDAAGAGDLAAVSVPTTQSEAAHTHDFDEACGNHGHYVSWFARYGEEAPCAVEARSEADAPEADEVEAEADDADADAVVAADSSTDVESKHEVKSNGKHTSGGNWQSKSDGRSTKGAKSNKKGGR